MKTRDLQWLGLGLALSLLIQLNLPVKQGHAAGITHYRVVSFKAYKNELQLQNLLNHYSNSGWEYMGTTPRSTGGIFRKTSSEKFVPIVIVLGEKSGKPFMGVHFFERPEGMLINRVEPNGPSSQAGLQRGCVFLEIDGIKASERSLKKTLAAVARGEKSSFLIKARQDHGLTWLKVVKP